MELEEISIGENIILNTSYQFSMYINTSYSNFLDFYIYVESATGISYIDTVIEYSAKENPTSNDWARISSEVYNEADQVFDLIDYVVRKNISAPSTFCIRSRNQGRFMRIGVKADNSGGSLNIGLIRRYNNRR